MSSILFDELKNIQSKSPGLYQCSISGVVEVVIEENEFTFTTLTVGDLLGLSTCVFSKQSEHEIIRFPDNKTLSEMMDDPLEFVKWFDLNIKKSK